MISSTHKVWNIIYLLIHNRQQSGITRYYYDFCGSFPSQSCTAISHT